MNLQELKSGDIKKLIPKRDPNSHKGMNGRILIVGGDETYHGAPVLSGMGALRSGADLVTLIVPTLHLNAVRSLAPDFIVQGFSDGHLDSRDIQSILEAAKKADVLLMGPGLSENEHVLQVLNDIVTNLEIPTVLDGGAIQVLQKIKSMPLRQKIVITPHHNEFENLTGKDIKINSTLSHKVVLTRTLATDLRINILLKGPQDLMASEEGVVFLNKTGNSGMTVGGSGDVLAGFIAGLIGQGAAPYAACQIATYVFGKAGEELFKQKGYGYTASDLAEEIPFVLKDFS